jgi:hypothetical protein
MASLPGIGILVKVDDNVTKKATSLNTITKIVQLLYGGLLVVSNAELKGPDADRWNLWKVPDHDPVPSVVSAMCRFHPPRVLFSPLPAVV